MLDLLLVACGGALGALCRFHVSLWADNICRGFPFGTLLVNVTGSFIMGLLAALALQGMLISSNWHYIMSENFLGALTTFSTFSIDTFKLFAEGKGGMAMLNVTLSMVLCLGGVAVGYAL